MRPEPVTQWNPNHHTRNPNPMALGDRIKTLRTENGWSQAHLGEHIGTDSQRISRYETGKITPSLDALIRIAQALNVTCDHLLLDDAPRHPLTPTDTTIANRINQLHTLNEDDRDAILHIIDGLIAKNRVHQALTTTQAEAS